MADRLQIRRLALALLLAVGASSSAPAQILGGGLPSLPGGLAGGLPTEVGAPTGLRTPGIGAVSGPLTPLEQIAGELASAPLADIRRLTVERLLEKHRAVVEADDKGQPVVRGEILATGLSGDTISRLRQAGFSARVPEDLSGLGVQAFVLRAPRGLTAIEALHRLRVLDPGGQYDFNHLYQQSGGVVGPSAAEAAAAPTKGRGLRIGLVDGGVDVSAPALSRARLEQRAFGPRGAAISAHGTAVASLIAGAGGRFRGAAPGATLYVADVYGPTAAGGSAESVARALAWLDQSRTPVISISLVGPPNLLLKAAIDAMLARGHLIVAAVGNDGPAAPPLYPAAYPGVVAVTGVDARRQVLPEAGRGTHVDFAAPGADMAAARVGGGFVAVRGTSFAAPIVAARLARIMTASPPAQAVESLGRTAIDLGAPGADRVYGRGLIGEDVRIDPARVAVSHTAR